MKSLKITPETKVAVIYADNSERETTIAELDALFSDESAGWRNCFFTDLELEGRATTQFAEYVIRVNVKDSVTGLIETVLQETTNSFLVTQTKISDKGINCNNWFEQKTFEKRFQII